MIYLAISANGFREICKVASDIGAVVWCGCDAVTDADFAEQTDINISRFTYPLEGVTEAVLQRAIDTIREHHPGKSIWVESSS